MTISLRPDDATTTTDADGNIWVSREARLGEFTWTQWAVPDGHGGIVWTQRRQPFGKTGETLDAMLAAPK